MAFLVAATFAQFFSVHSNKAEIEVEVHPINFKVDNQINLIYETGQQCKNTSILCSMCHQIWYVMVQPNSLSLRKLSIPLIKKPMYVALKSTNTYDRLTSKMKGDYWFTIINYHWPLHSQMAFNLNPSIFLYWMHLHIIRKQLILLFRSLIELSF